MKPAEDIFSGHVLYAAVEPFIDDSGNLMMEPGKARWGFVGGVAQADMRLERLDPIQKEWLPTDRVFAGERQRIAFSKADQSRSVEYLRHEHEMAKSSSFKFQLILNFTVFASGFAICKIFFGN